jgi:hypothetical protein
MALVGNVAQDNQGSMLVEVAIALLPTQESVPVGRSNFDSPKVRKSEEVMAGFVGGGDTECTQGYDQRCGVAQGCLLHGFVPQYGLHSGAGDASHSAGGHRVVCRSLRRLVRSSEPHGGCLTYGTFCQ